MRDRSLLIVASFVAVLVLGAGTLYIYDSSQNDQIAKGVRVAGVDIGGMSASKAKDLLAGEMSKRLSQPVVLRSDDKTFRFTPRLMHASFDLNAMVNDAVARSREGNIFTRTIRSLRGQSINDDLPADVHYSQGQLTRFLTHVEKSVDSKPQDASLKFLAVGLSKQAGRDGLIVNSALLRSDAQSAMAGLSGDQTIQIKARRIHPKVTKSDLAKEYPEVITVDRGNFKLRLFKHLKLVKTYGIAVGQAGLETPAGLYHIQNKQVDPSWSVPNRAWAGSLAGQVIPGGAPNNPLKARWMGIFDGAGIHGTAEDDSIGSAASHGCIRMHVPDVIELYDQVPIGAPVYIV